MKFQSVKELKNYINETYFKDVNFEKKKIDDHSKECTSIYQWYDFAVAVRRLIKEAQEKYDMWIGTLNEERSNDILEESEIIFSFSMEEVYNEFRKEILLKVNVLKANRRGDYEYLDSVRKNGEIFPDNLLVIDGITSLKEIVEIAANYVNDYRKELEEEEEKRKEKLAKKSEPTEETIFVNKFSNKLRGRVRPSYMTANSIVEPVHEEKTESLSEKEKTTQEELPIFLSENLPNRPRGRVRPSYMSANSIVEPVHEKKPEILTPSEDKNEVFDRNRILKEYRENVDKYLRENPEEYKMAAKYYQLMFAERDVENFKILHDEAEQILKGYKENPTSKKTR